MVTGMFLKFLQGVVGCIGLWRRPDAIQVLLLVVVKCFQALSKFNLVANTQKSRTAEGVFIR
jgi:hypothetical protein